MTAAWLYSLGVLSVMMRFSGFSWVDFNSKDREALVSLGLFF